METTMIQFYEWDAAVKAAMALTHSPEISWSRLAIQATDVSIDGDPVFGPVTFTRQHRQTMWYCSVDEYQYPHLRCDFSKSDFILEVKTR